MARTTIPGKRTILVRKVEAVTFIEKRQKSNPKRIYVNIDNQGYCDSTITSRAIGRCLFHMLPDLHLSSLHSMLYNLETAKEMVAALLDKPSKQLAGVQKLIDNARTKMNEQNDMEHYETRLHIISYITEHILRFEDLGELHGFLEVPSKKNTKR